MRPRMSVGCATRSLGAGCTHVILNHVGKNGICLPYKSVVACCYIGLFLSILLTGCSVVPIDKTTKNQQLFEEQELSAPYDQITLKKSLVLDAMPKIRRSQDEHGSLLADVETVSHGDQVVASLGQSRDGSRTWFNMVTFHQYRLNVIRKCFFAVDDKSGSFGSRPRRGLRFDCEMVLEKDVLDESHASENLRRIAILRYVLAQMHKDIKELGDDVDVPDQYNKKLDVCGMLINQMFETVLVKLEASPVLAMRLSETDGAEFDHINFNKGTVRMVVVNDAVAIRIRFGAFTRSEK